MLRNKKGVKSPLERKAVHWPSHMEIRLLLSCLKHRFIPSTVIIFLLWRCYCISCLCLWFVYKLEHPFTSWIWCLHKDIPSEGYGNRNSMAATSPQCIFHHNQGQTSILFAIWHTYLIKGTLVMHRQSHVSSLTGPGKGNLILSLQCLFNADMLLEIGLFENLKWYSASVSVSTIFCPVWNSCK